MIKHDDLITFYQAKIDVLRCSLSLSQDELTTYSINLDIDYFLSLISQRLVFINKHCI